MEAAERELQLLRDQILEAQGLAQNDEVGRARGFWVCWVQCGFGLVCRRAEWVWQGRSCYCQRRCCSNQSTPCCWRGQPVGGGGAPGGM